MVKNNLKNNMVYVTGNKTVAGKKTLTLPTQISGIQNQIVQVSNSSPVATYIPSASPAARH